MPRLNPSRKRSDYVIGSLLVGSGLAIVLAVVGVLPLDESQLSVPRWVFGVCGWAVFSGGMGILTSRWQRLKLLWVALMVAGMAVMGIWVTVWGPLESIRGGIPFLPDRINQYLGKIAFGIGSIITGAILVAVLMDLFRGDHH